MRFNIYMIPDERKYNSFKLLKKYNFYKNDFFNTEKDISILIYNL